MRELETNVKGLILKISEVYDNYGDLRLSPNNLTNVSLTENMTKIVLELRAIENIIDLLLEREIAAHAEHSLLPNKLFSMLVEWQACKIENVISHLEYARSVQSAYRSAREGKWGILKTSAVSSGVFLPNENKELSDNVLSAAYRNKFEVQDRDLLINRANSPKLIGTSVLVNNPPKRLIISDKLWRIVLSEKNSNAFFYALLNTPEMRKQISIRASGGFGSMVNISQKSFKSIIVPLPPYYMQEDFGRKLYQILDIICDAQVTFHKEHSHLRGLLKKIFDGSLTIEDWETYKNLIRR